MSKKPINERALGTITMMLPVPLTEDEKRAYSNEVVKLHEALDVLAAKEKSFKAALKSEKEEVTYDLQARIRALRSGKEDRPVKVEEVAQFGRNVVVMTRLDTGEVFQERPIRPEERQEILTLRRTAAAGSTDDAPSDF